MGISLKTHKLLWAKSGNRCGFPECKIELVFDESETDDSSIVGEEAHIVARKENGPRGKSNLSFEKRDLCDNLILLCRNHHKIVDDQIDIYTVAKLKKFKLLHETWVKTNLTVDKVKQNEDQLYASYVDKFIELAHIQSWRVWTSHIFGGGETTVWIKVLKDLKSLINFTLSRVWPGRYIEIERAFHNFKYVSNDFLSVFSKYKESNEPKSEISDEILNYELTAWTNKFYKISEWDPKKYDILLEKYEYHCLLIEDLVLEMTRAANHLLDMVRKYLLSGFMLKEGVLLVEIGPFEDLKWKIVRTEYKDEDESILYNGLRDFMTSRNQRNFYRGNGISEDYFINLFK